MKTNPEMDNALDALFDVLKKDAEDGRRADLQKKLKHEQEIERQYQVNIAAAQPIDAFLCAYFEKL